MNAHSHKIATRLPYRVMAMAGFSLIEMMVSITIGLMIVAALVGVLTSNSRSSKTNDRTTELQSNGRYAMEHLRRELRHAGYRGYTWSEPNTPTGVAPANECLDGGAAGFFVANIRQGIWGANDNNPYNANCLPAANHARGDVLVIRRLASAPANTNCAGGPAGAATAYFRSTYAAGQVFQGTTPPGITVTAPCGDFELQEYVYYISPFTNSIATTGIATENPQVPALYRIALQADGSMAHELVVSGIEHMQLQYSRATTDLNTRYYDANSINGASTDTVITEWDDVNAVRIWLLARNAKAENGYSNTTSYEMGDRTIANGNAYTVNDSFRRQLFTTVVELRN